jgi:hypothetical protein
MDEIKNIKERNARVEADKAWETSFTRRFIIATVTYTIAGIYMGQLGITDPWLNALIPTGGYVFSTLSLGIIKKIWIEKVCFKKGRNNDE